MAEKAIRLGGESTADAIVSAVDAMYTEHTFAEKDFALKHNEDEISVDTNFAAQNFWKEALIRFFNKKSAVLGLVLIVIIVLLAVLGPGMNSYTYSGQDLSQKNFAPRVPGIEQFGILDGSEKMSTTTGTKVTNAYQEKDKLDVYYWFGSDLYGRDIWTRTWEGARVSLIIAVAAAIIDMGTATTICVVDEKKNYIGGAIIPGMRIAADTLTARTAQLPKISLEPPAKLIGKNTVDCMKSGVFYGNVALIDGMLDRIEEEMGQKLHVIATGGLAKALIPYCRHEITLDDALLLKGLKIIYEKNK